MSLALLTYLAIFGVSLAALLKASDWFVDASERIGLSLGISPFVIGVTIVAFGTSLPELAASIVAVFDGTSEIVIGNVVGSNVANICLVLGVVAIVARKVELDFSVLDVDIPVIVASAVVLWALTRDGSVGLVDGLLFVALLVISLINSFRSRRDEPDAGEAIAAGGRSYVLLLIGAVGVYFGAKYTVESITDLSAAFGIDSGVIAASLVALGTSLPEVIVSVDAARKGKPGMAVGNVVGSNIFNSFGVMGIPALFGEIEVPLEQIAFSLPYMVGITLLFAFFATASNVSRWEGVMLVGLYVIFVVELF